MALLCRIELNKETGITITVDNKDGKILQTAVMDGTQIVFTVKGDQETSTITQKQDLVEIRCKTFDLEAETVKVKSTKDSDYTAEGKMNQTITGDLTVMSKAKVNQTATQDFKVKGMKVEITADTDLKAKGLNVTQEATTKMEISGLTVEIKANTELKLAGTATAKLSGALCEVDGKLTKVNGQLVKIGGGIVKLG